MEKITDSSFSFHISGANLLKRFAPGHVKTAYDILG